MIKFKMKNHLLNLPPSASDKHIKKIVLSVFEIIFDLKEVLHLRNFMSKKFQEVLDYTHIIFLHVLYVSKH